MRDILIGYLANIPGSGLDNYLFQVLDCLIAADIKADVLCASADENLVKRYPLVNFIPIPRLIHPMAQILLIRRLIVDNQYRKAYFNISEAFHCIGHLACAGKDIQVLTHSHSSQAAGTPNSLKRNFRTLIHYCFRPFLNWQTDIFLSCSGFAADWMYGKSHAYQLIRNTVETERFSFSPAIRKRVRQNLNIGEETKLLGFAGRLVYQKNPLLLPSLFSALKEYIPDLKLAICGDGELKEALKIEIQEKHLEKDIFLLGIQKNMYEIYNAFDAFILPSLYEGMPIVGIEAQVNGLPVIFSDHIDPLSAIGPNVMFADLETDVRKTAPAIAAWICRNRIGLQELTEIYSVEELNPLLIRLLS